MKTSKIVRVEKISENEFGIVVGEYLVERYTTREAAEKDLKYDSWDIRVKINTVTTAVVIDKLMSEKYEIRKKEEN